MDMLIVKKCFLVSEVDSTILLQSIQTIVVLVSISGIK